MTRTLFEGLIIHQLLAGRSWMCMIVWSFCNTQGFGPEVVTEQSLCRDCILLSFLAGEADIAGLGLPGMGG